MLQLRTPLQENVLDNVRNLEPVMLEDSGVPGRGDWGLGITELWFIGTRLTECYRLGEGFGGSVLRRTAPARA